MKPTRPHTLLALASMLVVLAGLTAAGAGAAPAQTSASTSLCSTAKSLARTFVRPPSATTLNSPAEMGYLKTNLGKILGARSALVSSSPKKLKADMRKSLAFLAQLKSLLSSANWSFATLTANAAAVQKLEAGSTNVGPSFTRVGNYFRRTCHIK